MLLKDLVAGIEHAEIFGNPNLPIEQIEYDSRLVKANSLFVAVRGYKQDGYDFVEQAVGNGAVAVLGERESCDGVDTHVRVNNTRQAMADAAAQFYGFPGTGLDTCGVTGTNGKTTTCYLIQQILKCRGKIVGLISSEIYDTGDETFKAHRTTPESLDLQRLLYLMRKNQCANVVLEVSSHALALDRVRNISFQVAVFTNITRDHLDFHGTMENYLATKAQLLKRLAGSPGTAVINLDVPEFRSLFGDEAPAHTSYSLSDKTADVHCGTFELKPDRTILDLVTPLGTHTVTTKLPGRFNLYNVLAAAAGGLACGADLDAVIQGIELAAPVPGRLNVIKADQPFAVYLDYAHTPDAIERLCETVRELVSGRLLILFGCGGDRDKGKRPMMGQSATKMADYAVLSTDNPRSEDPEAIIEDVRPGLVGDSWRIEPDRRKAIRHILSQARPGDAVLLAGKGAEDYQEVKGVRHPFSDEQEALAVMAEPGFYQQKIDEEK